MKVLVVHGPNLNLLGRREPDVYGTKTLDDLNRRLNEAAASLGITLDIHQTQHEGEIIELLHGGIGAVSGAIVNPGGYAHTSRAIADAFRAVGYPVVEVHLSNIHGREPWRARSVTAEAAAGVVTGFEHASYVAALHALKTLTEER
ncbi:MAG TPA: type II 3-dehydroquinate dehydratase [Actinomycetota bacterium]|jgi:3-dehydroquinate dehydratase II|nr:type II 3-dehydroquinate dehydratase [Actinomycetota bacterium]